jgi:2-methylaconitate cis-trans-isomerase PrpF
MFAEAALGKERLDYGGNYGNIISGTGPFALHEGG